MRTQQQHHYNRLKVLHNIWDRISPFIRTLNNSVFKAEGKASADGWSNFPRS